MFRVFLAVVLLLFAGEATGLFPAALGDACTQDCPDDDPGGQCPPVCACPCCAHVPPLMPVVRTLPVITDEQAMHFVDADAAPPSAEPRSIFHVPKSVLA